MFKNATHTHMMEGHGLGCILRYPPHMMTNSLLGKPLGEKLLLQFVKILWALCGAWSMFIKCAAWGAHQWHILVVSLERLWWLGIIGEMLTYRAMQGKDEI